VASRLLAPLLLVTCLALPAVCEAQGGGRDSPPSMFTYGFNGIWLGAALGLSMGYLSTGSSYDDGEWKNLVIGAGIGAIVGVAGGITLGLVDTSSGLQTGRYVLRDTWYGTLLGALTGAAVGALLLIDSGDEKDILVGAAIGALIGAAAGAVYGVVEGQAANRRARVYDRQAFLRTLKLRVRLTTIRTAGTAAPAIVPTLLGAF
jgi:hypothetical protein